MLPVAHDPLCARIAEQAGFKAICTAGYANSAALLAKPDVDLLTLSEMVDAAWRIVDAVDIPVFADGDTGHGNVTNVVRTVRQFEKAGVASLLIEDQVSPKRCGHMAGKDVIPAGDMVAKLNAALDARQDLDFMITARTDAIAVNGIDDAIERANLYRDAQGHLRSRRAKPCQHYPGRKNAHAHSQGIGGDRICGGCVSDSQYLRYCQSGCRAFHTTLSNRYPCGT